MSQTDAASEQLSGWKALVASASKRAMQYKQNSPLNKVTVEENEVTVVELESNGTSLLEYM